MVEEEEDCGMWGREAVGGKPSSFPSARGDRHGVCQVLSQAKARTDMDPAISVEQRRWQDTSKQRHIKSAVKEASRHQARIRTRSHLGLMVREGLKEQL